MTVEEIVGECARLRVGGVILYASGYAETRLPERVALQDLQTGMSLDAALFTAPQKSVKQISKP